MQTPPKERMAVMSEILLLREIPMSEMSFIPFVISIEPNSTPFNTGQLLFTRGISFIIPISVMKKMRVPPTLNISAVASPIDSGKMVERLFLLIGHDRLALLATSLLKHEKMVSIKSAEP